MQEGREEEGSEEEGGGYSGRDGAAGRASRSQGQRVCAADRCQVAMPGIWQHDQLLVPCVRGREDREDREAEQGRAGHRHSSPGKGGLDLQGMPTKGRAFLTMEERADGRLRLTSCPK